MSAAYAMKYSPAHRDRWLFGLDEPEFDMRTPCANCRESYEDHGDFCDDGSGRTFEADDGD